MGGHKKNTPVPEEPWLPLDNVSILEKSWKRVYVRSSDKAVERFHEDVLDLARASARHGYLKVAELASMIDVMLAPVLQGDESLTTELKEILRDYMKALRRVGLEHPVAPRMSGNVRESDVPQVLLLGVEPEEVSDLAGQLAYFGYEVNLARSVDRLLEMFDQSPAEAVVIDESPRASESLSADAVSRLRDLGGDSLPLLIISERSDMDSRLRAARAGVDAYLLKPLDLHQLVDRLDGMVLKSQQEPLHILIVEDSSTQAAFYSTVLRRAGMRATVVQDPYRVLETLDEHPADLLLVDMYMPRCNGNELARVIRQVPNCASIPIVYLSAETEIERQLDAMSIGGDDFLTKPIDPAHLIRSVSIRAERARGLRGLMLTDNLTGLLNHSRLKDQLHIDVARADRRGERLAFAMLDIDHFKSVNDTHGHLVGDRVIKTLARVLRQRLRVTDSIGRYGGEEFAVILPDAGVDEAEGVLNEIRASFAKIRQMGASGPFSVTFSGGIATFPRCRDATDLVLRADKALYAAKRSGRDRICTHPGADH